jgi:chromosome segregation ATPase
MYKSMMRHNLSVAESDKLGAALCKDIIDNYTGHNSRLRDKIADLEDESRNVRYYNATLRDEKAELESMIHNLRDHVREHNIGLQQELDDCKKAFADLMNERNEYQESLILERIDHRAETGAINNWHHGIHKRDDAIIKTLGARIEHIEAMNDGLEHDLETLRMVNILYQKRWNERKDLK